MSTQTPLPKKSHLGVYVVEECLSAGGFGITYLCRDTRLDRKVAVKECFPLDYAYREGDRVLPSGGEDADILGLSVESMKKEASVLAPISQHPSIVEVYDTLELNGTCYMVMKLIEGTSLEKCVKQNQAPNTEKGIIEMMLPLLKGLHYVHGHGVMHRDIKPGNIMLERSGNPVIVDFGSARNYAGKKRKHTTFISDGYAPIEQYEGTGNQGPWTDIYAAATVIYELACGKKPTSAEIRNADESKHKPLARLQPSGFSATFMEAVDWALALEADDRPQSIPEWLEALARDYENLDTSDSRIPARPQPVPPPIPGSRAASGKSGVAEPINGGIDHREPVTPDTGADRAPAEPGTWILHCTDKRNGTRQSFKVSREDFRESYGRLIIGRTDQFCDFALTNDSVSRQHVTLIFYKEQLSIEDRNSSNGTWLGQQELRPFEPETVAKGDVFTMGEVGIEIG